MNDIEHHLHDINQELMTIRTVQVEQSHILTEHVRRSTASEHRLDLMESFKDEFDSHMDQLRGAAKLLKWVASLTGFTLITTQLLRILEII